MTEPDTTDPADGLSEDERESLVAVAAELERQNLNVMAAMLRRILAARQRPTQQTSAERAALARAWDEGMRTGSSRAMRHMSDEPGLPLASGADNPYRREGGSGG